MVMMEKLLPIPRGEETSSREASSKQGDEKLKNRVSRDDPTKTSSSSVDDISKDSNNNNKQPSNNNNGLIASLIAWYAASVVCTNTSKSLGLPWQWLTLTQLVIGSFSAYFGIAVLHLNGKPSRGLLQLVDLFPSSTAQWQTTTLLTATFVGGFVTLNMALHSPMHVSTVMTVRAAEPVATLLLGLHFLPNEKTSPQAVAALIPVVAGAAMASTVSSSSKEDGDDSPQLWGLGVVLLCNCLFALRTIFTKRLKAACPSLDNFTLFFQLCVIGTVLQLVLLCSMKVLAKFQQQSTTTDYGPFWLALRTEEGSPSLFPKSVVLILNGISFYAYLQLSWVVMGQVGAVTHSVCNSLRRPVICAAGWMIFGGATVQGVAGGLMATAGTILYAQAKRKAAAATAAASDAPEDDSNRKVQPKLQLV